MVSQTVIAIIPEEHLSDILTHIHRAGLGHNARVLRPRRGPLKDQLRRAGVPVEQAPRRLDAAGCILMIMAAARSPMAANLVLQQGASATWTVSTSGIWSLVDDHVVEQSVPTPVTPVIPLPNDDPTPDAPGSI